MATCTRATSRASASNSTKKQLTRSRTSRPTCPTTASWTAQFMTGDLVMTGDPAAFPGPAGRHVVVMGVSGCGKSTVGEALAEAIGARFLDGDTLHPASNIAKMAAGTPLDDGDRVPWLAEIGRRFAAVPGEDLVIACSALKRS